MKRFRVKYTDESDQGCPVFDWRCQAADARHAEEKFLESNGADGWKVVRVEVVK